MKEKKFGTIYSLGEDLDRRFVWCLQDIDTQSGCDSAYNDRSFIAAIPIKRFTGCLQELFELQISIKSLMEK
jgi:hypothetical protein